MMQTTNYIAFRVPDMTQNDGYRVVYLRDTIQPSYRQAYMSAMQGYLHEDPVPHSNEAGIMNVYPTPEVPETNVSNQSGGSPAAQHVLDSLPTVVLSSDALLEQCTICLENMGTEEVVTTLPCDHIFHKNCIVLWLSNNNTCPLCRSKLPKDEIAYQE